MELAPEGRLELTANNVIQVGENLRSLQGLRHIPIHRWVVGQGHAEGSGNVAALLHLDCLPLGASQELEQQFCLPKHVGVGGNEEAVLREDDALRQARLGGQGEDPEVARVGDHSGNPASHEVQSIVPVPPILDGGGPFDGGAEVSGLKQRDQIGAEEAPYRRILP